MNRRFTALAAGGVIAIGGLAGIAAWGSQDPPPRPVTIEVLDRGGHWQVTGAPTWLSDEGDTMVRLTTGQRLTVTNHETVAHWVGPFRVPPGGSVTGAFNEPGVILGRCGPDAPETMRIEVVES